MTENKLSIKPTPEDHYFQMLRIRRIEEEIAAIYHQQTIRCPVHLCIGQEAVSVGVCASLNNDDWVFSSHRSHGHYLAKGGNLRRMVAEMLGKSTGCCLGRGGSMHLIDLEVGFRGATPIVASTIPIAVGAAFATKTLREQRIVTVFFGEGATEEGAFHEALNFAALQQLPVLFVCENNLYSVYSPLHVRQPSSRRITTISEGHGIRSSSGDGNDLDEVLKTSADAIERIRNGSGPELLEFATYRHREHCGPNFDNNLSYRANDEYDAWVNRCPLATFNKLHTISEDKTKVFESIIKQEWQDAISFAEESEFPKPTSMLDHVFA